MDLLKEVAFFGLHMQSPVEPPNFRDIDWSCLTHPVMHFVYVAAAAMFLLHFLLAPFMRMLFPKDRRVVADMVTFDTVAGFCCAYLSAVGLYTFYFTDRLDKLDDKLLGYDKLSEHIAQFMFAYQIYDLFIMAFIPELLNVPMVVHHMLSGLLGFIGLFKFAHGFAPFFFGIIEISNIALTFVDIFQHAELYKTMPTAYTLIRMVFAISFIWLRLLQWPVECYTFWTAVINGFLDGRLLQTNADAFAGAVFLIANFALTFLQFFWGVTIIKGVIKAVRKLTKGGADKPKPKKQ